MYLYIYYMTVLALFLSQISFYLIKIRYMNVEERKILVAYQIADRIPLRQLGNIEVIIGGTIHYRNPSLIELRAGIVRIYIYNFGTIVFFDAPKNLQIEIVERFISEYGPITIGLNNEYATSPDYLPIVIGEQQDVHFDKIELSELKDDAVRVVALNLSHSVIIDSYEKYVEKMLSETKKYSSQSLNKGRVPRATGDLIKFIGECIETKQEIISNLFILDDPEEVWEDPNLNRLYQDTKKMLDIYSRFKVIDYKLKLIQENLSLMLNIAAARDNFWLEMVIIILILSEMILALLKYL
jgi:required for meiotic nuclear division protein 1